MPAPYRTSRVSFGIAVVALATGCAVHDGKEASPAAPVRGVELAASQYGTAVFQFDADVSIQTETAADGNGAFTSPPPGQVSLREPTAYASNVVEYHLSYLETGDRIVVEITPPSSIRAAPAADSVGRSVPIWAQLQRIRMSSDGADTELTLWDGRVIRSDVAAFPDIPATRDSRVRVAITRQQRLRHLRAKLSPFLRVRAQSTLRIPGLETAQSIDSTPGPRPQWIRASDDFDVLQRRRLPGPAGSRGRKLSVALEVRNATLAGSLSPLP